MGCVEDHSRDVSTWSFSIRSFCEEHEVLLHLGLVLLDQVQLDVWWLGECAHGKQNMIDSCS